MKKLKFADSKKVVIKIGTSTISDDLGFDKEFISNLSMEVSAWLNKGIGVVVVSSGAVFAGLKKLKLDGKPSILSDLQAAAAVGQMDLAQVYTDAFLQNKKIAAQVLLTHEDLSSGQSVFESRLAPEPYSRHLYLYICRPF